MYTTRHRFFLSAGEGVNINRSSDQRNAVNVFPLPVGAQIKVHWPELIAGHPSCWARVGVPNEEVNHSSTAG
jgi:hypothetical protein